VFAGQAGKLSPSSLSSKCLPPKRVTRLEPHTTRKTVFEKAVLARP